MTINNDANNNIIVIKKISRKNNNNHYHCCSYNNHNNYNIKCFLPQPKFKNVNSLSSKVKRTIYFFFILSIYVMKLAPEYEITMNLKV